MVDETHTLTANGINNQDTASLTVPADVQRDLGVAIDDELEVTIDDLGGLFESITFTGNQIGGDSVTIPAELVRKAGIQHGKQYPVSFALADDDEVEQEAESGSDEAEDLDDEEYAISDDSVGDVSSPASQSETGEVEEAGADSLDDVMDEEFGGAGDENDADDEEEDDKALGELFG